MTEVKLDRNTKGVLVYAKAKKNDLLLRDCILLIESVRPEPNITGVKTNYIFRHAAMKVDEDGLVEDMFLDTFIGDRPHRYGQLRNYVFYTPTILQRNLMKNFLVKTGYRFDKENNKLIKI